MHIQDVPELMLRTWRGSTRHHKDSELDKNPCAKRHSNPLRDSCFCLFFTHVGVAVGQIFNKEIFITLMVTQKEYNV